MRGRTRTWQQNHSKENRERALEYYYRHREEILKRNKEKRQEKLINAPGTAGENKRVCS